MRSSLIPIRVTDEVLREWYRTHLGFELESWGGLVFRWAGPDNPTGTGSTVWSVFEDSNTYFAPSQAPFMVNYRVADLHALIAVLRAEGCNVDAKVAESEYGKFGWVMDPDGNRITFGAEPVHHGDRKILAIRLRDAMMRDFESMSPEVECPPPA